MNTFLAFSMGLFLFNACQSLDEKPAAKDIAGAYHRVGPKDTLDTIAKKYRVSVQEIKDVNGIEEDRLRLGQMLFLPDPDPILKKIEALKPAKNKARKKDSVEKKPGLLFDFPITSGVIVQSFSKNKKNPYDGIGIKAPLGTPVKAAQQGKVLFVGDDGTRFGLLVILEHQDPFITVYTQLDKAHVRAGQAIKKGQPIGTVGKSGGALTPHLHFQIRFHQKPVDPKDYLTLKKTHP